MFWTYGHWKCSISSPSKPFGSISSTKLNQQFTGRGGGYDRVHSDMISKAIYGLITKHLLIKLGLIEGNMNGNMLGVL